MPQVLYTKRKGIYWPGANPSVSEEEAKQLIKDGYAVEYSEENRKKIRELVEGTKGPSGLLADSVNLDDYAELQAKGLKRAEGGTGEVVPIEHEPQFADVDARRNPPAGNAGASPDAPSPKNPRKDEVQDAAAKTTGGPVKK
jgi:hypothetical protein